MNDIFNEDGYLAQKVDIWAVGVSIYTFITEELPFYAKNDVQMFTN